MATTEFVSDMTSFLSFQIEFVAFPCETRPFELTSRTWPTVSTRPCTLNGLQRNCGLRWRVDIEYSQT